MELINTLFSLAIANYWTGVAVAFVAILIHLKIWYCTDWTCRFRKYHYLFLLLCPLSWLVPVAYLVGFVGFAVYFVLYCIVTFFITYE